MHAYEQFQIPPGDTLVHATYDNHDISAEAILRFVASPGEVYEIRHEQRKDKIFFLITDSGDNTVASFAQFRKKISRYLCPNKEMAAALFEASASGDIHQVLSLLDDRAEPDCAGPRGFTPLIIAAANGRGKVVRALIDAGATVNATTGGGWTALIFASDRGHTSIALMLIDAGANVNLCRPGDYTALMAASEHGYSDIVRLLLNSNAYTESRHINGKTALDFALAAGHKDIAAMLKNAVQ